MEFKGKTYKDNKTGENIRIVDSYQNIAVTDKHERISTDRLSNSLYYTEELSLDPDTFLNSRSTYDMLANIVSGVDLTNVPDDGDVVSGNMGVQINMVDTGSDFRPATNESAILQYDEEYEKEELARKYGAQLDRSAVIKQNEEFDRILNPDSVVQKNTPRNQQPVVNNSNNKEYVKSDYVDPQISHRNPVVNKVEDPIINMFKNVKRKEKFVLALSIEDKLPRKDFIEMMEDSYETSIIEYLADDMLQKLLNDPKSIRDKIINEIELLVYPNGKPVNVDIEEDIVEVLEVIVPVTEKDDLSDRTIENKIIDYVNSSTVDDLLGVKNEVEEDIIEKEVEKVVKTKRPRLTPEYIDKSSETIVESEDENVDNENTKSEE